MVNEVKQRIDLIISCQGKREISKENLEFMFEKYELSAEERREILDYCRSRMIRIFSEEELSPAMEEEMPAEEDFPAEEASSLNPGKKKGFLSRLFGN